MDIQTARETVTRIIELGRMTRRDRALEATGKETLDAVTVVPDGPFEGRTHLSLTLFDIELAITRREIELSREGHQLTLKVVDRDALEAVAGYSRCKGSALPVARALLANIEIIEAAERADAEAEARWADYDSPLATAKRELDRAAYREHAADWAARKGQRLWEGKATRAREAWTVGGYSPALYAEVERCDAKTDECKAEADAKRAERAAARLAARQWCNSREAGLDALLGLAAACG